MAESVGVPIRDNRRECARTHAPQNPHTTPRRRIVPGAVPSGRQIYSHWRRSPVIRPPSLRIARRARESRTTGHHRPPANDRVIESKRTKVVALGFSTGSFAGGGVEIAVDV